MPIRHQLARGRNRDYAETRSPGKPPCFVEERSIDEPGCIMRYIFRLSMEPAERLLNGSARHTSLEHKQPSRTQQFQATGIKLACQTRCCFWWWLPPPFWHNGGAIQPMAQGASSMKAQLASGVIGPWGFDCSESGLGPLTTHVS